MVVPNLNLFLGRPSEGRRFFLILRRLNSCDVSTICSMRTNKDMDTVMDGLQKIDGPCCSITVRMLDASRVTNRFSVNGTLLDVFKWLEGCDIVVNDTPLKSQPIYCLVQQSPFRKFVKYADGSVELINSENMVSLDLTKGTDTKNKTLKDLELEDTQLFILHIPSTN